QRIQSNADMAQRIQRARDAGFSDEEIFGRMGLAPRAPADQPANTESIQTSSAPGIQVSWPEEGGPSFAQRAGGLINEAGRQVGLTARYGMEGLGQVAGMLS